MPRIGCYCNCRRVCTCKIQCIFYDPNVCTNISCTEASYLGLSVPGSYHTDIMRENNATIFRYSVSARLQRRPGACTIRTPTKLSRRHAHIRWYEQNGRSERRRLPAGHSHESRRKRGQRSQLAKDDCDIRQMSLECTFV